MKSAWDAISGFEESEHPASINESMQPIMENLQRGASKGGNEYIDVDEALGYAFPPVTSRYDEKDLALYALGVGAGGDPLDDRELGLVYELHGQGFKALPTFGVIPAINVILEQAKKGITAPGLHYGFDRVLHGEQVTELERPLPPHAKLRHEARIKDIFDKGKGALVVTEIDSYDEDGDLLVHNEVRTFVRGAGGWGGDRGPSAEVNVPPDRAPDAVVEEHIPENQALLYRLSGDWNPLHADPSFAKAFGFDRPILHGLCTFGYAGRHVIAKLAPNGDPRFFKRIEVRFAKNVFPGETLVTEMWKESDQRVVFRCKVKERDEVVISNAALELYEQIPKKAVEPKAAPKTNARTAAPSAPTSADIFAAIRHHVETHPELASKVGTVFLFRLTDPESAWTIDLKAPPGGVTEGEAASPDCTLEISEADFIDMASGKADAQKLYFSGKLKISGNVMASQKLTFLSEVDREAAKEAVAKARAERAAGGVAPAPAKKARQPVARAIFDKLGSAADVLSALGTRSSSSASPGRTPRSWWTRAKARSSRAKRTTRPPPSPSKTPTSRRWCRASSGSRRSTSAASCAWTATSAPHTTSKP